MIGLGMVYRSSLQASRVAFLLVRQDCALAAGLHRCIAMIYHGGAPFATRPCPNRRHLASTSSSSDNDDNGTVNKNDKDEKEEKSAVRRRRRRRHNFDLERVPSFEAFQQQQKIRSLYRQFLRLAYKGTAASTTTTTTNIKSNDASSSSSSTTRDDLLQQIRHEFRQVQPRDADPWTVKRALSEGGRRYKELAAMLSLGASVSTTSTAAADGASSSASGADDDRTAKSRQSSTTAWPWHGGKGAAPGKPLSFPKR